MVTLTHDYGMPAMFLQPKKQHEKPVKDRKIYFKTQFVWCSDVYLPIDGPQTPQRPPKLPPRPPPVSSTEGATGSPTKTPKISPSNQPGESSSLCH